MTNKQKQLAKKQFIIECNNRGIKPTKSGFSKMLNESLGEEKYITLTFRQDTKIPTYTDARTHTPIIDSFKAGERVIDARILRENATTINIEFADGTVAYDLLKELFVETSGSNKLSENKVKIKEIAKRQFITECNKRGIKPTKSGFNKMLNEINII